METISAESLAEMEQKIINAPEEEYMNDEQLAFFRLKLVELHDTTRERIREAKEQMLNKPDTTDPLDKAAW